MKYFKGIYAKSSMIANRHKNKKNQSFGAHLLTQVMEY
jgi:hypothetical protein